MVFLFSIKQIFWAFWYYCFLVIFFMGIWVVNGVALLCAAALPAGAARLLLRSFIHRLMQFYIGMLEMTGVLVCNRQALKYLHPDSAGALIIANHPSILDAPVLLSGLPGLVCVFKHSLRRNLLLPVTARTAGYLSNDGGMHMLRSLVEKLRSGELVLLFPEGTRTDTPPLNTLNGSYALAALRARVPVQLVCIHYDSPVLTKRQHFLQIARFPARLQLGIGPVIQPGDFLTVRQMNRFVEEWFRRELSTPSGPARRYLPFVVSVRKDAAAISADFCIPQDPFYCKGHMPGQPIVPGFAQMAWVHEVIQEAFPGPIEQMRYTRIKFLRTLSPGDRIRLTILLQQPQWRLLITRDGETVTQGCVSFQIGGSAE